MAVADDLQERERQAGNADDSSNPGNRHYNESLSNKKNDDGEEDYNKTLRDNDFGAGASDTKKLHGDDVPRNYNADAKESHDEVEEKEKKPDTPPDSLYKSGGPNSKKKSSYAGKSAAIALLGGGLSLILAIGMAGDLFTSLLNNMKELFHNENTSSRTNVVYRNAMYASKFTKGKCTGKIPVLCRFQSMSDRQIERLERAGFRVEGKENRTSILNRVQPSRLIAPDGTSIDNGRSLHTWANNSPDNARMMRLATKGRAAFWWNEKYNDIQKKWGIDKAKKILGLKKEEQDRSVDRNTNGSDESGGDDGERRTRSEKKGEEEGNKITREALSDTTNRISKAGWIAAAATATCGIYNMSHKVVAYAKSYHIEQMIKYANVFLNTADRIKDEGDIEPEIVSYAGKIMTDADPREKITTKDENDEDIEVDNPDLGKTATDSQAYETVTHGDTSELSGSALKFRPGGYTDDPKTSWLGTIDQYTKLLEVGASAANPAAGPFNSAKLIGSFLGGMTKGPKEAIKNLAYGNPGSIKDGRQAIRYACIAGEDAAMTAYVVMCGLAVAELFTGALTGLGAAQLVGCAAAASCAAADEFTPLDPCGDAVDKMAEMVLKTSEEIGLTDKVLSYLQTTAIGSFTRYTDAGNAWGAGNAFLAESTSMGYGLRPAKDTAETQQFVASTNSDIAMDEKLAYEDARSTPFDLSNRYSFLGTMARKANLYFDERTPVYSSLLSTLGLVPRMLSYNETAMAQYSQPIQSASERYSCPDPDIQNIGIKNADKFCSTVGITPEAELMAARKQAVDEENLIEKNVEYMTKENGGKDLKAGEDAGGTLDDSFCEIPGADSLLSGIPGSGIGILNSIPSGDNEEDDRPCKEVNRENSIKPSIDETGKTIEGSQYAKYEEYCTEQRKDPWGTFSKPIQEATSNRDIDWFTGEQCLKDTEMMKNFRTYYNMCTQSATMDDTKNCWSDEPMTTQSAANVTTSECSSNGDTKAIYTCALKYDNYRYVMGGGHSDVPNAQAWIAEFKNGAIPEWTPILDCSGLVRMAFVEAMGIEDQAYVAPGGYDSSKYWEKIPLDKAQQGDIVTSFGHVAIIEANDTAAKSFKIFHASTSGGAKEDNIKHSSQSYGGSIAAFRAKKVTGT